MKWTVKASHLSGTIVVPPSKSHTIRALLVAALAQGESRLVNPLLKGDGASALGAIAALGARYRTEHKTGEGDVLYINGFGGNLDGGEENVWLGNSGTGLNLIMSAAALGSKTRRFDGDASLRSRPVKPLLDALAALGARYTIEGKNSSLPFTITGPLTGGETTVSGLTSQYLSSLLFAAARLPNDTLIRVSDLHERPYVDLTLWWLNKLGVRYETVAPYEAYRVKGGQGWKPIDMRIPGDFSGATFAAVAAAVTRSRIELSNIDFSDPQGDKGVFDVLERSGISVLRTATGAVVDGSASRPVGIEIDLNAMPDSLPALAVLGTVCEGETRLVNVKQARIKETDRIAVMTVELRKMGADIEELPDGLVIRKSALSGAAVNGHDDHRVVMSLALAGMIASGETVIGTAEAAEVTYPSFYEDFRAIGAKIQTV